MGFNFNNLKNIHLVGIGGSGLSSLARFLLSKKIQVSGSDSSDSKTLQELKNLGAKIFIGHTAKNLPENTECLIYTVAADKNNPEITAAKKKNIPIFSYPEALGMISRNLFTVAISGTHGKTTTTNMIGKILTDAGLKPLVIAGATTNGVNIKPPGNKYFVVEACEYRRSFLNIHPDIAVITNIDNDHLDYYKDEKDTEKAFAEFIANLKTGGMLVSDSKNIKISKVIRKAKKFIDFNKAEGKDRLNLKVPGEHNIKNASAALSVAKLIGIPIDIAIKSLNDFSGAKRRFEFKGKNKNEALVFDDYAHHPTEIEATLLAAKKTYPKLSITVIFQPHLYSRTKTHLKQFAKKLKIADEIILLPIYAAREKFDPSIKSENIAHLINSGKNKARVMNMKEAEKYCLSLNSDSLIITMGAGDVYKISDSIIDE